MLHFRDETWDLNVDVCPCDVHFLEFLAEKKIRKKSIFHFGTGNHHVVGVKQAESGSNNAILGITASPPEYESYMKLAIDRPEISKTYKAIFGDIYQLDARLLPAFDVVSLFHLCEFWSEENAAYGALTDLDLALILADKLKPGGWMLFYKGSMAFDKAKPVIAELGRKRPLEPAGEYKTLLLYRNKT